MLDVQADPDFLATVQNILECYRLRFPATHIRLSSRVSKDFERKHKSILFYGRQGSPRVLGNLLNIGGRFCLPRRSSRCARMEICNQPRWKRDHACHQQVYFMEKQWSFLIVRELVMELSSAPKSTIFTVSRPMPESEHWRFQNKFLPLSLPQGYDPENQCKKLISPAKSSCSDRKPMTPLCPEPKA